MCCDKIGVLARRHELVLGHHVGDKLVVRFEESQIASRQDANQLAVTRDRDTADVPFVHDPASLTDRRFRRQRDRIDDHAVFGSLHAVDLQRLLLGRHVLVNDADAALLS